MYSHPLALPGEGVRWGGVAARAVCPAVAHGPCPQSSSVSSGDKNSEQGELKRWAEEDTGGSLSSRNLHKWSFSSVSELER